MYHCKIACNFIFLTFEIKHEKGLSIGVRLKMYLYQLGITLFQCTACKIIHRINTAFLCCPRRSWEDVPVAAVGKKTWKKRRSGKVGSDFLFLCGPGQNLPVRSVPCESMAERKRGHHSSGSMQLLGTEVEQPERVGGNFPDVNAS